MMKFVSLSMLSTAVFGFKPETVTYEALLAGTGTESLVSGLSGEGLLAVSDVPGFTALKEKTLAAASGCALSASGNEHAIEFTLPDGTTRHSLANKVVDSVAGSIEGADMTSPACQSFEALGNDFRELVDTTVEAFMQSLDVAEGSGKRALLSKRSGEASANSFREIKSAGVQLEHFHTYNKPATDSLRSQGTVNLHVDQGLFIALTPALMLDSEMAALEGQGHGFKVELTSGEMVEPNLAEADILFMVGDGVSQWVGDKMSNQLRAVPHAMSMPEVQGVRSWYGRMILPAGESYLAAQDMTFDEIRSKAASRDLAEVEELASKICSYGYELNPRALQEDCAEGELWCWMRCMPIPEDCKGPAKCADPNARELCPLDVHNMNCTPVCRNHH